jgi:site-specific DNA-cytosine methylase
MNKPPIPATALITLAAALWAASRLNKEPLQVLVSHVPGDKTLIMGSTEELAGAIVPGLSLAFDWDDAWQAWVHHGHATVEEVRRQVKLMKHWSGVEVIPHRRAPRAADAFAGGGLYDLALLIEGWDVGMVCEANASAVRTLRRNLHPNAQVCDARTWMPPKGLDLLTGGPPCQNFSKGGKQEGAKGKLNFYPELIRWIDHARPRIFAFENSAEIETAPKFMEYFDWWWSEIDKLGYEGVTWVLNAADYGSPQNRLRAWVVGWPKGAAWGPALLEQPPVTHGRPGTPRVVSGELLPWTRAFDRLVSGCCAGYGLFDCENVNNRGGACETCFSAMGSYPANYAPSTGTDASEYGEEQQVYMAAILETKLKSGKVRIQPRAFKNPQTPWSAEAWDELGIKDRRVTGYLSPVMAKNLIKGRPYGLIATDETPLRTSFDRNDPVQLRAYVDTLKFLSPRTAAKLMDVPNWYRFSETEHRNRAYEQIGNGITVNMGRAVGAHLMAALGYKTPLPGSMADGHLAGLWPMEAVDGCAWFPGVLGYPGGSHIPGSVVKERPDLRQRPLDQPEDWAAQRGEAVKAAAGWQAWGEETDVYQHDPAWRPGHKRDHPPGFPDLEYFRQWIGGEDQAWFDHYARLYAELGVEL